LVRLMPGPLAQGWQATVDHPHGPSLFLPVRSVATAEGRQPRHEEPFAGQI